MIENRPAAGRDFPLQVSDDLPLPNDRNLRIIHAGKGVIASCPFFSCTRADDHLAVKHDADALGAVIRGIEKAVSQVLPGVSIMERNGFLGPGQDHRLGAVLHQIGKCCSSVCHGIGTVGNDKAVVRSVRPLDLLGNLNPVERADIGAVKIHQLDGIHMADAAHFRNGTKEVVRC